MRLADAIEEYLIGEGLALKTIQTYRYGLEKLLAAAGRIRLRKKKKKHRAKTADRLVRALRRCLKDCEEHGLSKHTQHQVRRSIRTFFEWLVREEYLERNPIHRVRKVRLPKQKVPRLSDKDKRKLLDAALEGQNPKRDFALLCVWYDTGIRLSEMANLGVWDINLRDKIVLVQDGKGAKDREVPLGSSAKGAVVGYLDGRDDGPLFLTMDGRRFKAKGLYRVIRRIGKRAGVKVHPHLLRHTFGKDYLRWGDARALQQIFGHNNLSTIEPYTGDTIEELVEKHEKASPVNHLLGKGQRQLL